MKGPYYKEDKEIEKEYFATDLSQAMFQRLIAKPSLVRGYVTPLAFKILCEEVNSVYHILRAHETVLSALQERIQALESQSRKSEVPTKIESANIENIKHLRELFELPEITGEVNEDILTDMKGMLRGKSKEKIDSLELLRQIRGE